MRFYIVCQQETWNTDTLLQDFADMNDLLDSECIEGVKFRLIIMDDDIDMVGQD